MSTILTFKEISSRIKAASARKAKVVNQQGEPVEAPEKKVIVVQSENGGAGKSTTSMLLAETIRAAGATVKIIDGDATNSAVHDRYSAVAEADDNSYPNPVKVSVHNFKSDIEFSAAMEEIVIDNETEYFVVNTAAASAQELKERHELMVQFFSIDSLASLTVKSFFVLMPDASGITNLKTAIARYNGGANALMPVTAVIKNMVHGDYDIYSDSIEQSLAEKKIGTYKVLKLDHAYMHQSSQHPFEKFQTSLSNLILRANVSVFLESAKTQLGSAIVNSFKL